jgi:hypothetical protein
MEDFSLEQRGDEMSSAGVGKQHQQHAGEGKETAQEMKLAMRVLSWRLMVPAWLGFAWWHRPGLQDVMLYTIVLGDLRSTPMALWR